MNRRSALRLLAAPLTVSAGCLADAPGATGPRNPPEAPADDPRRTPERDPLSIDGFDYEETDDGRLRVLGTVENRADAERRATVRVRLTADDEYVRTVELDVPPGSTAEFETIFDVSYEDVSTNLGINLELV